MPEKRVYLSLSDKCVWGWGGGVKAVPFIISWRFLKVETSVRSHDLKQASAAIFCRPEQLVFICDPFQSFEDG